MCVCSSICIYTHLSSIHHPPSIIYPLSLHLLYQFSFIVWIATFSSTASIMVSQLFQCFMKPINIKLFVTYLNDDILNLHNFSSLFFFPCWSTYPTSYFTQVLALALSICVSGKTAASCAEPHRTQTGLALGICSLIGVECHLDKLEFFHLWVDLSLHLFRYSFMFSIKFNTFLCKHLAWLLLDFPEMHFRFCGHCKCCLFRNCIFYVSVAGLKTTADLV